MFLLFTEFCILSLNQHFNNLFSNIELFKCVFKCIHLILLLILTIKKVKFSIKNIIIYDSNLMSEHLCVCVRAESMRTAVEQLSILGAVDRKEEKVLLTPLGKKMASFPLEPRFSKVRNISFFIKLITAHNSHTWTVCRTVRCTEKSKSVSRTPAHLTKSVTLLQAYISLDTHCAKMCFSFMFIFLWLK